MAWDFSTEPEFESKLDWMRGFVREEIMPLETLADVWRTEEGRKVFASVTAPVFAPEMTAASLAPLMMSVTTCAVPSMVVTVKESISVSPILSA